MVVSRIFLVDAAGRFSYSGHTRNSRVSDLKSRGHVEVPSMPPEPWRDHRWDGQAWILDPLPDSVPIADLGDIWDTLKRKFPQLTDADLPQGRRPPAKKP